jgi:hypothetical protein
LFFLHCRNLKLTPNASSTFKVVVRRDPNQPIDDDESGSEFSAGNDVVVTGPWSRFHESPFRPKKISGIFVF